MQTKGDYVTSTRGRVIAGPGMRVCFSIETRRYIYTRACANARVRSLSWSNNKNLDNAIVYTVDIGTPSITPWRIQLRQVFFDNWLPIDRRDPRDSPLQSAFAYIHDDPFSCHPHVLL